MRYLTVGDVIAFDRVEVGGEALADFGYMKGRFVDRPFSSSRRAGLSRRRS